MLVVRCLPTASHTPDVERKGCCWVVCPGERSDAKTTKPFRRTSGADLSASSKRGEQARVFTMGLAVPQIGVDLRIMIFGFEANPRYHDELSVPLTTLINPWIELLTDDRRRLGRVPLGARNARACPVRNAPSLWWHARRRAGFRAGGPRISCGCSSMNMISQQDSLPAANSRHDEIRLHRRIVSRRPAVPLEEG